MSRSVPEWVGKTDDTAAPPRVRLRIFQACGGICHISGRKITPADKWELEHVKPLCNGGENRESNLAPALAVEHKKKTAKDVAQKAKNDRIRKKHLGIETKKSSFRTSRGGPFKAKVGGGIEPRS